MGKEMCGWSLSLPSLRRGLSAAPCSRRVKQLEDDGYIARQVALLDRKLLGLTLTAYVQIGMDRHTPERFENFEAAIRQWPEVQECCLVTGMDADYQLKVMVRDMDHYQLLLLNQLTRIEGVTGYVIDEREQWLVYSTTGADSLGVDGVPVTTRDEPWKALPDEINQPSSMGPSGVERDEENPAFESAKSLASACSSGRSRAIPSRTRGRTAKYRRTCRACSRRRSPC